MNLLNASIYGEGKPLIILHGLLGMSNNWKSIAQQFIPEGFQIHLPDLRNHGQSFHSSSLNYKVMTEDLLYYVKYHNLEKIHLIGHSMGGKLAMNFALKHPHLLSQLVIVDIGPKFYPPHHQSILEGLTLIKKSHFKTRNEGHNLLRPFVQNLNTRNFLLKNLKRDKEGHLRLIVNLNAIVENINEIGEAINSQEKFEKPTLFLNGELSNYISIPKDLEEIRHFFPNSQIQTIDHAGHWLHTENPTEFMKQVSHFFSSY